MDRRRFLLTVAVVVALVGAGLVFVYAQSAETRAAETVETDEVLVATEQINPGESARDAAANAKFEPIAVPRSELLRGAVSDGTTLDGLFAKTTIYPGEQLIEDKFVDLDGVDAVDRLPRPLDRMGLKLALDDAASVGSFIQPGSQVKVFVSRPDEDDGEGDARASTLVEQVQVLAVGNRTLVEPDPVDPGDPTSVTLAVDQDEAELLLGAVAAGHPLALTLINADADAES